VTNSIETNNFDYWVKTDIRKFLIFFWLQYCILNILAIWLALRLGNPFAFLIIGFLPYFVILLFRGVHNPFRTLENGIKKYDALLYEHLSKRIPDKHIKRPKYRTASIYELFMKESEAKINSNLLVFKKNYTKINRYAMLSLSLWFFTFIALTTYLYITAN
jgi:hypothetical protein